MAAAIRASVAAQQQQQQEARRSEDREEGGRLKKEEAGARGTEEPRGPRRPPRTQGEGPGEQTLPAGSSAQASKHLGGEREVPDEQGAWDWPGPTLEVNKNPYSAWSPQRVCSHPGRP